jgi:hypothetical protein
MGTEKPRRASAKPSAEPRFRRGKGKQFLKRMHLVLFPLKQKSGNDRMYRRVERSNFDQKCAQNNHAGPNGDVRQVLMGHRLADAVTFLAAAVTDFDSAIACRR